MHHSCHIASLPPSNPLGQREPNEGCAGQGKRYCLPNTSIMLHHPSGSARGQASDIANEARELLRLRNYVNRVLADATSKPIEKVPPLCGSL